MRAYVRACVLLPHALQSIIHFLCVHARVTHTGCIGGPNCEMLLRGHVVLSELYCARHATANACGGGWRASRKPRADQLTFCATFAVFASALSRDRMSSARAHKFKVKNTHIFDQASLYKMRCPCAAGRQFPSRRRMPVGCAPAQRMTARSSCKHHKQASTTRIRCHHQ